MILLSQARIGNRFCISVRLRGIIVLGKIQMTFRIGKQVGSYPLPPPLCWGLIYFLSTDWFKITLILKFNSFYFRYAYVSANVSSWNCVQMKSFKFYLWKYFFKFESTLFSKPCAQNKERSYLTILRAERGSILMTHGCCCCYSPENLWNLNEKSRFRKNL